MTYWQKDKVTIVKCSDCSQKKIVRFRTKERKNWSNSRKIRETECSRKKKETNCYFTENSWNWVVLQKKIVVFRENLSNWVLRQKKLLSFTEHSGEKREILSHTFFNKNFVKVPVLLKKLLRVGFTKYFFSEREFLVFPHCV